MSALYLAPAESVGESGPIAIARAARPRSTPGAPELDVQIREAVDRYYTDMYRRQLGLPDWPAHVAKRHREEENFARILERVEREVLGRRIAGPRRVLVVGAGTGADFSVLSARGCETHGIEPNPEALAIAQLKARRHGFNPERLVPGVAEQLPYPDGHFDFVWSWTVIEHVQDVARSLSEMVRVLKPGGEMFIGTVDYRQCYEPHYKTPLPCFLPRPLVKLILRARGRNPDFYGTLALTNARQITRILRGHPVIAMHVRYPDTGDEYRGRSVGSRVCRFLAQRFDLHTAQHWLIRKRSA